MNGLKVLYVEDEPDIRLIGKRAMQSVGKFEVNACDGGVEALSVIKGGFIPDIIVLDVMMPKMNGPETLKQLREIQTTAKTPVVFMTAKVQASEISEYMALGAIGVVAKPFEPMTLAQQIISMLEKYRDNNAA